MRLFIATLTAALISTTAMAADIPAVPTPAKEHEWLKKLEGTWTLAGEGQMGGQTFQSKGTETVRSLGGFWIVSDLQCECAGAPMTGLMTVGYDTAKGKFVGTWVCSMCDHMCKYEGTLQGDVLTLNTEGPDPTTGSSSRCATCWS